MKKFLYVFLISLFFSFSIFTKSAYAVNKNIFDEGIYQISDFHSSPENKYIVQNISETNSIYLQVFDENQLIIQSIRLSPNSDKFNLIALLPSYRIVIIGNGNIYIS